MLKTKRTTPHFFRNAKSEKEKEYEKIIEEQKKIIAEQKISIQKLQKKIKLKHFKQTKEVECQIEDVDFVPKDAIQCNESPKEMEIQTEDINFDLIDAVRSFKFGSKEVECQTDDINSVPKETHTDATQFCEGPEEVECQTEDIDSVPKGTQTDVVQCNESQSQTDIIGSVETQSQIDENGAIIEESYNDIITGDIIMVNDAMIIEVETLNTEDDMAEETIMETDTDATRKTLNGFGFICELCRKSFKTRGHVNAHMKYNCKMNPNKLKNDYFCPVCKHAFNYNGLKCHINQFTKKRPSRATAHSINDPCYYQNLLQNLKLDHTQFLKTEFVD